MNRKRLLGSLALTALAISIPFGFIYFETPVKSNLAITPPIPDGESVIPQIPNGEWVVEPLRLEYGKLDWYRNVLPLARFQTEFLFVRFDLNQEIFEAFQQLEKETLDLRVCQQEETEFAFILLGTDCFTQTINFTATPGYNERIVIEIDTNQAWNRIEGYEKRNLVPQNNYRSYLISIRVVPDKFQVEKVLPGVILPDFGDWPKMVYRIERGGPEGDIITPILKPIGGGEGR